jgi:hypothetical protein
MSNSTSKQRAALITLQTLLGLAVFGVWIIIGVETQDEEFSAAVAKVLPYFIFYELGVLSRYVPGIRQAAKNVRDWGAAR